jgi:alkanesulfonate monooxygenase SsuD/methylene tetrahydromethanopterin reductase-like flavin-dependent oxidoreductase (luciferase family)
MKVGLMMPQGDGMRGPGTRRWRDMAAMAQLTEDIGFDSVWLVDHFLYLLESEDSPRGYWEAWTLLTALAAITTRVELGTIVLGTAFRNPALLAKMADTLEEVSDGRLILGVGAGYHRYEYRAFGYSYDNKISRFEEAVQIMHALLKKGSVDFNGEYYSASACELKPRGGPRPDGPPILIGGVTPRMLSIIARYADQWNVYYDKTRNSVEGARENMENVDQACHAIGRDPAELARTVTVLVADASADPWWERLPGGIDTDAIVPLNGEPEIIAEELAGYAALGVSHIQISLEPTTLDAIENLARALELLKRA